MERPYLRKAVSVTLPKEYVKAMEALSEREHRPRSSQYEVAVKAYLDSLIRQGIEEADYRQYIDEAE